MVLDLLDQLQIFSQLHLIELLGISTGLGLPELASELEFNLGDTVDWVRSGLLISMLETSAGFV